MKLLAASLGVAMALGLTGCQIAAVDPERVSVVVGLYPYAYLTQAIGQDFVTVINLTPPGAEPHDLELTARQVISIARAHLAIYHSGLQPSVDRALEENPPGLVIDVRTVVRIAPSTDDPSALGDPHVWLDPERMITIAESIAQALSEVDPDHAGAYSHRLAIVSAELEDLDQQFHTGLAHCIRTDFITTHEAFGYIADRYGLNQIAISGISPDADPSPARIAEIHQIATERRLTTVFFETLASPELARTIASDLGLVTDVLDPIEGVSEDSRGKDYPQIMVSNLTALREANGCS